MKICKYAIMAALLPMSGILATSCKGVEEGENTQTRTVGVTQLVIPDDATKEVTFETKCTYSLRMDFMTNKMTISGSGIKVGGITGDFRTEPVTFLVGGGVGSEAFYFPTVTTGMLGSSHPVTDLKGYLFNYRAPWNSSMLVSSLVMSYKVDDATVKTINTEPRYFGTTTTYFPTPAGDQTATTEDASYGVEFSEDMKKATVTIYNIKFAPNMPSALEAVILKDLDVTLDRNGYTISGGGGFIPDVREGATSTPYPNFPFSTFTLSTKGEYCTEVDCHYEVDATIAGHTMHFRADFSGKSADFLELKPL
ncbi:MAG: hypothetical protein K2I37_06525 [Muribaculaceae bacterium]|nr:hypothetical protein [Muribaculaceae bacterium]